jgi:hypothetical protein
MTDLFIEINPGYIIPLSAIQMVQWKDDKLRIRYDKAGTSTSVDIADVRGSAQYLYESIRKLTMTFETGPEFDPG